MRTRQLELEPFPVLLVDVRTAEEAQERPLARWLPPQAASVHLPGATPRVSGCLALPLTLPSEAELPSVLRPGNTAWVGRFGGAVPEASRALVFVCADGVAASRCASVAANIGFSRCSILEGGLDALAAAPPSRVPRCAYVSRCAPLCSAAAAF